jgi:hypothetical protein
MSYSPNYEIFESDLRRAHTHCIRHREELWRSGLCGCFYCLDIFEYKDIEDWTDHKQTALCPSCGIDSVIGDTSGFPITEDFLSAMKSLWFSPAK